MIGGRRVHVDDRAAHRDLAARLHLVLAPVTHRHELLDEPVAVDLHRPPARRRARRLHVRTEPLHERAYRRDHDRRQVIAADPQPPDDAQAPTHRLDRGRHPLERQRLPRREQLDRVGTEELAQVGGESLGFDPGRHREHHRPAGGRGRERGREQRPRGLGHRDRPRRTAGRGGDDRIGSEQRCEPGEGRGVGHVGVRVDTRDTDATRGERPPDYLREIQRPL